ncbi:MAG: ribonuclease P protein component [Chitinophagales bacterium]
MPDLNHLRFSKNERLCKLGLIEMLFREGKAVHHNGFTLVYFFTPLPNPTPAQILMSVPKKNFKRAHDRNRIKRLLRESWRHRKGALYMKLHQHQMQMALALVYKGSAIPAFDVVNAAIDKLLLKLHHQFPAKT